MIRILIVFFLIPGLLFAKGRFVPADETKTEQLEQPWFTGPLLAAAATTFPAGDVYVEPYFFATKIPAQYTQDWGVEKIPTYWTLSTLVPVWIGLTSWMDIQLQPQWSWNHQSNAGGHWSLGDFIAQLDFQLYRSDFPAKNGIPSMKFSIRESFPTGKYQNLDPKKGLTQLGGSGAWATSFIFAIGRMFHLSGVHYISTRANFLYTIFAPVRVKGFNAYGGGLGTRGKVYNKPSVLADLAFEVSLTKNWAFALDLVGVWRRGNKFSGKSGEAASGMGSSMPVAFKRSFASIQYSIAPAIEYNFNANIGILAGTWFTFAGKGSNEFYSAVIAFSYYK